MDCDVLIVGLGPVGGLLANHLGQAGVATIVVDEAAGTYDLPRAAVVDDEVLRIFQAVDLDRAVLRDAQVQRAITYVTQHGTAVDILRPERGELAQPRLVSIHQPSIERRLVEGLGRFASVDVRWRTRIETVDRAADHVDAWVRPATGGPLARLRARWLVGCDGGRSPVRGRIGAGFRGSTFAQRWIVLDALVDGPVPGAPHPHFVGDPDRPTVSLPMSPGRHRWEFMLRPDEDPAPLLAPAGLARLLAPWTSAGLGLEVERAIVYAFHARTASRWRRGRVLLAGDAAHVMPPFIGQGFSSGARDVANLAWRLEAVLAGAPSRLLDDYERERRGHVRAMQRLAVRWGGVLQTTDPRTAALRDRLLPLLDRVGVVAIARRHAMPRPNVAAGTFARRPRRLPFRRVTGSLFPQPLVTRDGVPTRLDDAVGRGWTLLTTGGDDEPADGPWRTVRVGRDLDDRDGAIARWLRARGATWVLLRPDRWVYASGATGDLADARAALARHLGPAARVPAGRRPEVVA